MVSDFATSCQNGYAAAFIFAVTTLKRLDLNFNLKSPFLKEWAFLIESSDRTFSKVHRVWDSVPRYLIIQGYVQDPLQVLK